MGVKEYFEDFHLFIGIVEDLNLNTRIWTKKESKPLDPMAQFYMNFPPSEPF